MKTIKFLSALIFTAALASCGGNSEKGGLEGDYYQQEIQDGTSVNLKLKKNGDFSHKITSGMVNIVMKGFYVYKSDSIFFHDKGPYLINDTEKVEIPDGQVRALKVEKMAGDTLILEGADSRDPMVFVKK